MPPSFPHGGMENPQTTFLNQTIVSGDRGNVWVVAHELSHSYSGKLVTNASWEHYWLIEGWTRYLERRILAAVYGEAHRDLSAIVGWNVLRSEVSRFGDAHDLTRMIVDLKGIDPDEAWSYIPYEKGYTLLSHLEKQLGRERRDRFIPHYFKTFARSSLDSYEFKSCLPAFYEADDAASAILKIMDWNSWFYM